MKLRKALLSAVSAFLCMAMFFGISAFAAEKRNIRKETKALTNAKYYSDYIKLVEKYSAKESKKSVTFENSLTKKFYEALLENIVSDDPEFVLNFTSRDYILSVAAKGGKLKTVEYSYDGSAVYLDKKEMTVLSVDDKEKMTISLSADEYADAYDELFYELVGIENTADADNDKYIEEFFGVTDSTKGKYFRIKSGDKTYYYEEFDGEYVGKFGFLFNSKGKPIAQYSGGEVYCLNLSYTVKDSEFKIPSGYKEME